VSGDGSGLTSLNAGNVSSGTLGTARIPNLDAGKITTGTLTRPISTTTGTFSGDVGIGTTSPVAQLHVASNGPTYTAIGGNDRFRIEELVSNGNRFGLQMGIDWGTGHSSIQTYALSSGGSYSQNYSLLLQPHGGNVGIGTTSPSAKLHINTGATENAVFTKYETTGNGYGGIQFRGTRGNGTNGSTIGQISSYWQNNGRGKIIFNDGGDIMILPTRNVGIGTSEPNHKLEVSGGILADYIAIPEINLYGARIGHVIEYIYSNMPGSAPTDESSMNSEFGQRHSSSITTNTQMRYPYGSGASNMGRMWIGIIQATSTGVYTFGVNSDDAGDLFVAGYRVADWYSGHGHNSSNINIPGGNQRTIYLKGGQWYKVKARFEENGGGEAFFALWKRPGDTSFSEIPSGNLAYILSDFSSAPTSDDRLKVNETMISNATDTIIKLKPQIYDKFEFIEDVHDTKNKPIRESGLIAQDIWYDTPELRHIVYPYKTPNETREVNEDIQQDPDYSDWGPVAAQVNYFGVIPYLIKSFQELHENVTSERVKTQEMNEDLQTIRTQLEQALQTEKEKTKTLESRLAFLETAVASLIS